MGKLNLRSYAQFEIEEKSRLKSQNEIRTTGEYRHTHRHTGARTGGRKGSKQASKQAPDCNKGEQEDCFKQYIEFKSYSIVLCS